MFILDQTTVAYITAASGLMAAMGGTFSAIAAYRSAGIARISVDRAREAEHTGCIRNVLAIANTVLAEAILVDFLSSQLIQGYETLFAFGNRSGSAGKEGLIGGVIKTKNDTLIPLQEVARETIENKNNLRTHTSDELMGLLINFEGYIVQINRIKEQFKKVLADVERQILANEEKVTKSIASA